MELTRFNESNSLTDMFGNFFGRGVSDFLQDYKGTVPSVNISETEDKYKVEVAAPGLKKDDFNIKVEDKMLVISAEKQDSSEEKEDNYRRREFHYNSFSRSFYLPDFVEEDKIDAKYKDGLLMLHIPKKEEAKKKPSKTIKIS